MKIQWVNRHINALERARAKGPLRLQLLPLSVVLIILGQQRSDSLHVTDSGTGARDGQGLAQGHTAGRRQGGGCRIPLCLLLCVAPLG